MIENIDANIGRLLARLDELGIAEDTLVVFTTDNGTAAGGRGLERRDAGPEGFALSGRHPRAVLLAVAGHAPGGVDVAAVTAHIDVLPTLCEITGAAIPPAVAATVEGRSLVPLLEDAEAAWPDRLLVTHLGRWERGKAAASAYRNCRVREGRWQLVNTKNRPAAWELYDIAADPGEQTQSRRQASRRRRPAGRGLRRLVGRACRTTSSTKISTAPPRIRSRRRFGKPLARMRRRSPGPCSSRSRPDRSPSCRSRDRVP